MGFADVILHCMVLIIVYAVIATRDQIVHHTQRSCLFIPRRISWSPPNRGSSTEEST
ncbi:hypothetical protein BDV40DRAFT_270965 [Aspergillus tamarii]|uniref:Uncharacterized protein n=1 Tax=Aspergillus tamarii TaxID=41984 RepID=A0A5N6UNW2_ASPTM|nr:hypothetical protein BDV40DRAFT_270965 [Aspergillus tamarii]